MTDPRATLTTTLDFHGDALLVHQDERGVWVVLKRVCEALGLTEQRQMQKLQSKPWAVTTMMVATGPDGKNYEMLAVHLDTLPMWLATIDVNRVAEPVRAKLGRYQVECARVLRDHFFGRQPDARWEETMAALGELRAEVAAMRGERPAPRGLLGKSRAEAWVKRKVRDLARLHVQIHGDDVRRVRALLESDLRFAVSFFGAWETLPEDRLHEVQHHLALAERVMLRRHMRGTRLPGLARTPRDPFERCLRCFFQERP